MISNYDVIQHIKNDPKNTMCRVSDDNKNIIDIETGNVLCSVDYLANSLRKRMHCDFTCIYAEHVSLKVIYRCNECGTVIFASEDEWYDPNLCCPTCGGYHCHFEYWTKEDIENDDEKQKALDFYKKLDEDMIAAEKRRQVRGGLYDWQLFKKSYHGKKYYVDFELRKLAGIDLEITVGEKEENEITYLCNKYYRIPLSPHAFYIMYIFPYTKKCTDERLRKYAFWQKKPMTKAMIS